jgi:hypothetical protein
MHLANTFGGESCQTFNTDGTYGTHLEAMGVTDCEDKEIGPETEGDIL